MIDIAEVWRLYRVQRFDFVIALLAIVGVLSAGGLTGVVIGVALSLGGSSTWPLPRRCRSSAASGTQTLRESQENPSDETFPGLAVVRLDGGLFFATADALHDRLREVVQASDVPVHGVLLDLEGVDFIDSQGAAKLAEIVELGTARGLLSAWPGSRNR